MTRIGQDQIQIPGDKLYRKRQKEKTKEKNETLENKIINEALLVIISAPFSKIYFIPNGMLNIENL